MFGRTSSQAHHAPGEITKLNVPRPSTNPVAGSRLRRSTSDTNVIGAFVAFRRLRPPASAPWTGGFETSRTPTRNADHPLTLPITSAVWNGCDPIPRAVTQR
jgi:hypothetical protein